MVKIGIYIGAIILMTFSCSPKKGTTTSKEEVKEETAQKKVYKKTLFIPLEYELTNLTLEEDVRLLPGSNLSLYKTFFNESLLNSLTQKGYEIVKSQAESNYQITIEKFSLKEFKLQVDGPSVNVASSVIKFSFVTPSKKNILFSEVNKESITAFDESVFQDVVSELAFKIVNKLDRLVQ